MVRGTIDPCIYQCIISCCHHIKKRLIRTYHPAEAILKKKLKINSVPPIHAWTSGWSNAMRLPAKHVHRYSSVVLMEMDRRSACKEELA